MSLILLIILIILLFGGGGYYGYRGGYYGGGGFSLVGLLLLIIVLWLIFGGGYLHAQTNINGPGNFRGDYGQNKTISATTSSSSTSWTAPYIASPDIYVYNAGAGLAYLRCGVGAQTATTGDIPIPPSTATIFSKGNTADTCAVLSASTSTVYIITGVGF